jgi:hypothetical protein
MSHHATDTNKAHAPHDYFHPTHTSNDKKQFLSDHIILWEVGVSHANQATASDGTIRGRYILKILPLSCLFISLFKQKLIGFLLHLVTVNCHPSNMLCDNRNITILRIMTQQSQRMKQSVRIIIWDKILTNINCFNLGQGGRWIYRRLWWNLGLRRPSLYAVMFKQFIPTFTNNTNGAHTISTK